MHARLNLKGEIRWGKKMEPREDELLIGSSDHRISAEREAMNAIHGLCLGYLFFLNSYFCEKSVLDKVEGKKGFSWLWLCSMSSQMH